LEVSSFSTETAYIEINEKDLTKKSGSSTSDSSTRIEKTNAEDGIAEIYTALHYCGKKMLQNIHKDKVVIGASGGIDSAVAAALYCDILGPENVLLINMPSRFNSDTTKNLAEELANNLGCLYTIVPIEDAANLTLHQLSNSAIHNLNTGEEFDLEVAPLVAENIQARDRSSRVLAAFASAINGCFTCNANKAETTVGYCTLYGDHAGFLAILADLWKHQVYDLGRYLNESVFEKPVIPQGIFDVVPSAELSELHDIDAGQGDPLHYPYHDRLFQAFQEWWQPVSPEEVLDWYDQGTIDKQLGCEVGLVKQLFPTAEAFISDLERWWKQFKGIGIAKRIQAPPIVAISRRAYGFDFRESQNPVYFSTRYLALKKKLLEA
jgi:NAD+ synthase (glutamine-hydrolysing)